MFFCEVYLQAYRFCLEINGKVGQWFDWWLSEEYDGGAIVANVPHIAQNERLASLRVDAFD